jgi:hypothetical protein
MVLTAIWFGKTVSRPLYFQIAVTFFVVGLASFLVWFSQTLGALRRNHKSS